MVDTIKFSQMTSGGDLANNETTPGLKSGGNVLFNNPWTFLAPGTTAQRPAPSSTINYRLRLNTDTQIYEYYDAVLGAWVQLQASATIAGPFITYTADATLPGAQNLGLLANGLLKQTITTGVATLDIAVNGTDFYGPGFVIPGTDGGTGINNGTLTIDLGSAVTGYILTSDVSGNATWQPVSASGGITTIDGDSGAAVPLAGVVTISGSSTGLTFTGSGSTLSLGGLLNSTFGGLGVSNPTAHGILVGEGASAVTPIVLSSGQILIGSTGLDPVAAAISSGTGILVGNGAGSITVSLASIATLTGLVNTTGSPAAPIATTLSAWMDAALGSVRGDIIYRNATVWTVLAPSTAGFSLQTGGAGADPAYSNTFTNSTLVTPATLGVQQQALDMNTHLINNVSTPVSANDAANKAYVDTTALNGTTVYAASAGSLGTVLQVGAGVGATLTNAGVQATFALDGANPPVGSNVLIKDTSTGMTAANEGIYTVTSVGSAITNWVLTRATSYDTATEINNTGLIVIQNGSTLAGTAWYNAATIVTVDTTAFNYSQFGNIIFPINLAHGGTNAALVASNGGIVYSTASAMAILAGTATAGQMLRSGATAAPTWSATSWPDTVPINSLIYANSANTMLALAPANSAVLTSGVTGQPLWVASTGTGSPVLATSPTLVTPILGVAAATSINFGGTTLANYLQGTFTPTLTGSSVNPTSITYSAQAGEYTRIGNVVHWSVYIVISALTIGAAAGNLQITGLPVASGGGSINVCTGSIATSAVTYSGQLTPVVAASSSIVTVYQSASASGISVLPITSISSSSLITASGFYYTS